MSHLHTIPFKNGNVWTPAANQTLDPRQKTVGGFFALTGVGVHSGKTTTVRVLPAQAGSGIVFVRTDADNAEIVAHWKSVVDTRNCTTIGNSEGVTVSTIEHLMAAFAAYGIDNARVEIDGPEMPIMDGSAEPFVDALESVGVRFFNVPRRVIRVLKEVSLSVDGRHVTLSPSMRYTLDVTFQSDRLPGQNARCIFRPLEDDFSGDLSGARTFGFFEDAEKIKAMGLAKGASLENTVVFDQEGEAMNDAGLRYEDECVRHKVLDAMGDLHLAGGLLMGHLKGTGVGHTTNHKILVELFKDPTAWCIETL